MSDIDKQIKELETKASKLKKLKEMFPDLVEHTNRWKTVRYCSKSVNERANKVDIGHSCGCCADAAVQAWPYIETELGPVYSDPPCFTVGARDESSYTDQAWGDWAAQLKKHNISQSVIYSVNRHFEVESGKYNDYYDDSQDDDDNEDI